MALYDGTYDEEYKPTYRVRDESYTGPDESFVPRYYLERVTPTGGMAWGVTSYTDRRVADQAANVMNALVLYEVP